MRATEILFESRAAVLKAEAETKLVEKQIELELMKQSSEMVRQLQEQNTMLDAEAAKDEALLRQALEALELSQPAWCGQDEELHDQECIDHRAAIAALRERLDGKR
jgi:hypothetical protein